jgi:DNA modification methylase
MKPRFREKWDDFQSFDDYVGFTETWIDGAFRTLVDTGSMFIWTTFHNAGQGPSRGRELRLAATGQDYS